jgi:hypothetical protein
MSRLTGSRPSRLVLFVGAAAVVCASLWWVSKAPGEVVDDSLVDARVLAVAPPGRGPDRGPRGPTLVMVEIEPGSRARLWLRAPLPRVGGTLRVRVKTHADGSRTLAAAR